jgi:predicted DNA repair protein MutK
MAGGLVALLDDVAALAKLAAASLDDVAGAAGRAGAKAAGVVIDDTAVTPRYVVGLTPDRELPIIWKITLGSLRNKLLFILPIALLLSAFAPWAVTPLLMLGGSYLCFEAAEKIIEALAGHHAEEELAEVDTPGGAGEAPGRRRGTHRFHPVGRDHGDRARRTARCLARHACRRARRGRQWRSPSASTASSR